MLAIFRPQKVAYLRGCVNQDYFLRIYSIDIHVDNHVKIETLICFLRVALVHCFRHMERSITDLSCDH